MRRQNRRLGLILAALAISTGLYGLWWNQAAEAAKAELERWIEARRGANFNITHEGVSASGFPMRIDLIVAKPVVSREGKQPFAWHGPDEVAARISPLAPGLLNLEAHGAHRLDYRGKQANLVFETAEASLNFSANGFETLHLTLERATVSGFFPQPLGLGRLVLDAAHRRDVPPDDLTTPTASLSLALEALTLPPEAGGISSEMVKAAHINLSLRGPVPSSLKAIPLTAWSDAGGILNVDALHAEWGPMVLDGDGTLALDRQLMPIAPFGLKAKGVFEMVDALAERGWIEEANALPVKLALAVLAKEPPDPDNGMMRLPLTLQGRDLFIGPARLARLPNPPWIEE
ncbi:MAG: DUF2125 domain-containing protein [Alphaproteobacteria bacterium]|nr:DUF2125 domain-containing protein [Alphaproteobacteria bacterium]